MESLEITYLVAVATISITFVGFSSVVVVFRQTQGNRLDRLHIFLVRFFIEMGLIVTGFSLLPLLLAVCGLPITWVWRIASAAYAIVHLIYIRVQFQRLRQYTTASFSLRRNFVAILISIVIDAALILNAIGWPFGSTIGPYVIAITWGLMVAGIFFAQTVSTFVEEPPPASSQDETSWKPNPLNPP
jgi:hypothetical protein